MGKNEYILKIRDLINSGFAVSTENGDLVYNEVKLQIDIAETIIIDFEEIDLVTTSFLNSAIGQLYKDYTAQQLAVIKTINIRKSQLVLLEKVINTALHCYNDQKSFNNSVKKHLKHG